ncbi:small ribosomal subunit protein mS37 isoform X2 [Ranitomeya variabilis]|uniref:small ribosomal subunit protein mS37 isoform X2 n=1 Tax=Ranitomeya variabilis TaxID=490064 RepID=UPI00405677CD
MASQGNLLNEKVARLVSRRYGKPVLEPRLPLALADRVANRRYKLGEATCITEMSVLMACWKENAFSDTACSTAIKVFYDCVAQEQVSFAGWSLVMDHFLQLPPKIFR